jgi:hypothetical protein
MKHTLAVVGLGAMVVLLACTGRAFAEQAASYPKMAPIAQYLSPSLADEIALARSAAPPSVAKDAEVLVFGEKGYETAATGSNGFVCLVVRAWANNFDSADFWNPRVRAPHCFNAAAVRTVLPTYLRRTKWALSGASRDQIREQTNKALTAHEIVPPETGAMAFMLGKDGYLGDNVHGHWHPHVMFYLPRTPGATWGANAQGSPIFADAEALEPVTVFFVPVGRWSDGTSDDMAH